MSKSKIIDAGASIVDFAKYAETSQNLRHEAMRFQLTHGPNLYSDYLLKHGCRPDPQYAANIGKMMGTRVKASDGSMHPCVSHEDRTAKAKVRKTLRENELADLELSRACDAIAFLAQNNIDPQNLMGRLSPLEEQTVDTEIGKAVEWLRRFADERRQHGQSRIVKTKK